MKSAYLFIACLTCCITQVDAFQMDTTVVVFRDAVGKTDTIRYGQPFFVTFVPTVKPDANTRAQDFSIVINNKHFPQYVANQFFLLPDKKNIQLMFLVDHRKGDGQNLAEFLGTNREQVSPVKIEIVKAGTYVTANQKDVLIKFYTNSGLALVWVFSTASIGILLWLTFGSNLLKEPVQSISLWRWSLAKTQLAIWTLTIAVLYLIIWTITFSVPEINGTVLALLGISFATTAIGTSQDSGKVTTQVAPVAKRKFFQFFEDLVDDGNGASIHRFQNLVFIAVFVSIFIGGTYANLQFPIFDTTQLGLLGISSAGYLGMKFLKESK